MSDRASTYPPYMPHKVVFEGPDTVRISLVGPLGASEAKTILFQIRELSREHGPLFWLIDVTQFSNSGDRVRDLFLNAGKEQQPMRGGVMFGSSFAIRVAMMMAFGAGARIMPQTFSFDFDFVANEEQARAWIASKRTSRTTSPNASELSQVA